jgi:hypothetical protein
MNSIYKSQSKVQSYTLYTISRANQITEVTLSMPIQYMKSSFFSFVVKEFINK